MGIKNLASSIAYGRLIHEDADALVVANEAADTAETTGNYSKAALNAAWSHGWDWKPLAEEAMCASCQRVHTAAEVGMPCLRCGQIVG